MPSKFRLRYIFRPIIRMMARALNRIGMSANMATCIMLSFAFLSLISLGFFHDLLLFGILVFLVGIFDGIDGAIARISDTISSKGAFLDSTMDRISEFLIFLALLLYRWDQLLWNFINMNLVIFLASFSSLMVSYLRARADNFFKGDFDIGLMARSERLFYLFMVSIISYFFGYFDDLIFLFMGLVVITAVYRYVKIKNYLKK